MIVASAPEEPDFYITFIVTNRQGNSVKRFNCSLASTATLQELHEKCADEQMLVPGTFELRSSGGVCFRLTDEGTDSRQIGAEPELVRATPPHVSLFC